MKFSLVCSTCIFEELPGAWTARYDLPFNNHGLYRFTCINGHDEEQISDELDFVLLAEAAVQALLDGYFRDSILSFSACLERFFEHFVQSVMVSKFEYQSKGVALEPHEGPVRGTNIRDMWKQISAQSERQLGAYVATYFAETCELAPLLSQEMTKLRNNVAHKGYFPDQHEAYAYGQAVVDIVHPTHSLLRERYARAAGLIRLLRQNQARIAQRNQNKIMVLGHQMFLGEHSSNGCPILSEELERRRQLLAG